MFPRQPSTSARPSARPSNNCHQHHHPLEWTARSDAKPTGRPTSLGVLIRQLTAAAKLTLPKMFSVPCHTNRVALGICGSHPRSNLSAAVAAVAACSRIPTVPPTLAHPEQEPIIRPGGAIHKQIITLCVYYTIGKLSGNTLDKSAERTHVCTFSCVLTQYIGKRVRRVW